MGTCVPARNRDGGSIDCVRDILLACGLGLGDIVALLFEAWRRVGAAADDARMCTVGTRETLPLGT